MKIGHNYEKGFSVFTVWSNKNKNLKIKFPDSGEIHEMIYIENGYFQYKCDKLEYGTKYLYITDKGCEFPDPASKSQPNGVHSYSAVTCPLNTEKPISFKGFDMRDAIFYELHIGTFTKEGTFEAATKKIPYLKELGITCVEIMPLASFPGERNWGYDGVFPFSIQHSYGSAEDFIKFINECNKKEIGVILDVVYNHFGPEGNYLSQYASYFTKRFTTPWGEAISYDGSYSKHVKNYFMENARFWLEDIKIDGFRLDATSEIYDYSDKHFLEEIIDLSRELELKEQRVINVISENPYHLTKSKHKVKLDGHWLEDFHHASYGYFTGNDDAFSGDYGKFEQIKSIYEQGFCSKFWSNQYYNEPFRVVVSIQSHDQVGNRPDGGRLSRLIDYKQYILSAFSMFASPFTPLIFMGEEYFETNPFFFFCSFGDERVRNAVRNGRKKEAKEKHKDLAFFDPTLEETFENSKLDFSKLEQNKHKEMFELYKILIYLRKNKIIGISNRTKLDIKTFDEKKILMLMNKESGAVSIMNFSDENQTVNLDREYLIKLSSEDSFDLKELKIANTTRKVQNLELQPYSFYVLKIN